MCLTYDTHDFVPWTLFIRLAFDIEICFKEENFQAFLAVDIFKSTYQVLCRLNAYGILSLLVS
jgi:hypothetical protein